MSTQVSLFTCTGYDMLFEQFPVEGQSSIYYDRATGSPVAEVGIGGSGPSHCVGPSCFVAPGDCVALRPCPPQDDAGIAADVGTDGT